MGFKLTWMDRNNQYMMISYVSPQTDDYTVLLVSPVKIEIKST